MDWGDDAIIRRYYPDGYKTLGASERCRTSDVVRNIARELEEKGIDHAACFAILNAAREADVAKISEDLRNLGVELKSCIVEEDLTMGRQLTYVPETDRLDITRDVHGIGIGPNNIGHSFKVASADFHGCTAVIIDYGEEALFAHCYSTPNYKGPRAVGGLSRPLDVGNVVEEMAEMLSREAIKPSQCFAVVFSGSQKGLEIVLERLRKQSIAVKWSQAEEDLFPPRTISYNALENKVDVFYGYGLGYLMLDKFLRTLPPSKEDYIQKIKKREKTGYLVDLNCDPVKVERKP